jgi:hypothetical protein
MKKFPKVPRLGEGNVLSKGEKVLIQEKMDGANFRFKVTEDGLVFGSRNQVFNGDVNDQFEHAVQYVRDHIDLERAVKGTVVFGEAMHSHTLEYDWDNTPSFLGYGMWDNHENVWANPRGATSYINSINLPTVQTVGTVDTETFIDRYYDGGELLREELVPESEYRDGKAEGVVINNFQNGELHRAKARTEKLFEKHMETSPSKAKSVGDEVKLVNRYCTPARVEKIAYKLIDEGKWDKLQMEMMEDLAPAVLNDIWEEEYDEIIYGGWEIDMPTFRRECSSEIARVLKKITPRQAV